MPAGRCSESRQARQAHPDVGEPRGEPGNARQALERDDSCLDRSVGWLGPPRPACGRAIAFKEKSSAQSFCGHPSRRIACAMLLRMRPFSRRNSTLMVRSPRKRASRTMKAVHFRKPCKTPYAIALRSCGGGPGWGRPRGLLTLPAASSTEASEGGSFQRRRTRRAPPPQPSPQAGEGVQRRKRRFDSNQGHADLVRDGN